MKLLFKGNKMPDYVQLAAQNADIAAMKLGIEKALAEKKLEKALTEKKLEKALAEKKLEKALAEEKTLKFIQDTNIGGAHRLVVQRTNDLKTSQWGDEKEIVTIEIDDRVFCSVGSLFQGSLPKVFEVKKIEYITKKG